jgi:hypothetical protein
MREAGLNADRTVLVAVDRLRRYGRYRQLNTANSNWAGDICAPPCTRCRIASAHGAAALPRSACRRGSAPDSPNGCDLGDCQVGLAQIRAV